MQPVELAILSVTLLAASFTDITKRRVPNILVGTGFLSLFFVRTVFNIEALGDFMLGSIYPLALLSLLFIFGMMGAGDIKLLMVLGGMIGFPEVLDLCLWSFVAGGIVAVCKMVFVTGVKERLLYLLRYVRDTGRSGKIVPYRKPGRRPENFPFAVPVFAAAVLVVGRYVYIFM